jgi:hypothetical protein
MSETKRFRVCQLSGPVAEGVFKPQDEAIDGADFATWDEAERCIGVFPGKGCGYIWDGQECCVVRIVSWERKVSAN